MEVPSLTNSTRIFGEEKYSYKQTIEKKKIFERANRLSEFRKNLSITPETRILFKAGQLKRLKTESLFSVQDHKLNAPSLMQEENLRYIE